MIATAIRPILKFPPTVVVLLTEALSMTIGQEMQANQPDHGTHITVIRTIVRPKLMTCISAGVIGATGVIQRLAAACLIKILNNL